MNKPWMMEHPHWEVPVRYLIQMADSDEEAALRTLKLKFFETIEGGDPAAWASTEFLLHLLGSDPDGFWQLLSHPSLSDDSKDGQETPIALLYLESQDPASASVIGALPWVKDGITGDEHNGVVFLQDLALKSQQVFQAILKRERHWLPPRTGAHVAAFYHLVSISAKDESAVLQIIEMPFLETIEPADSRVLSHLKNLAASDPVRFREVLSYIALGEGTSDDMAIFLSLESLRAKDPEAATAIETLVWVQDGIGRPRYTNVIMVNQDPSELEERMILSLIDMASNYRRAFMALMSKPWIQDDLTKEEKDIIDYITYIMHSDEATAVQIIEMPFLDSVEGREPATLEILYLFLPELDGLLRLLSHPTLTGGITDDQRETVELLHLEWEDPEAAATFRALPWVLDGLDKSEQSPAFVLLELARESPRVFKALANRPWLQDGLSPDEMTIVWNLTSISGTSYAKRDEAAALRIIGMPFMESVDRTDAAVMELLSKLFWESDQGYFYQVLSHPTLSDGITDDYTVIVASLRQVDLDYRPELLDVLLDPEKVTVKKRVIHFPHSGEVALSVIHIGHANYRTMDILEEMVRAQEGFMAVPFPTSYVVLLIADVNKYGGSGSPDGIPTIDPGGEEDIRLIAHELAHTYWHFSPSWISEGGAQFMEAVSADAQFSSNECSLADNLSGLDHLYLEYAERGLSEDIIFNSGCPYTLGRELFLELYDGLGYEAFREGFAKLYLMMRDGKLDDECYGLERGVCYVRAAFVTTAPPEAAAIAEPVIQRHYYGPS